MCNNTINVSSKNFYGLFSLSSEEDITAAFYPPFISFFIISSIL